MCLLFYTDGLTDLLNAEGEYFDEEKVLHFTAANYRLSATEFKKELLREIDAFKGDQVYPDDFTVLICKIA